MAAIYKIRARVPAFELAGQIETNQDVKLEEQRLLVPMDGSQTIGDLYYEIQRIYGELYNQARNLRIRCLETEDGELLHTSLRISDCFERRIDSSKSSQWTVIARRQAPTPEELELYKRSARQLSFDDQSFVRPQMPFSEALVIPPQEVSATPLKAQLAMRAPVQSDPAEDIIPSTERETGNSARLLCAPQAHNSVTLVPNSQQPSNGTKISDGVAQAKYDKAQSQPKGAAAVKAKLTKHLKAPAPRKDVYDIASADKTVSRKRATPEQDLPETSETPSTSKDDRPSVRKSFVPAHQTPSSALQKTTSKPANPDENDMDHPSARLQASLAKERAETQKLVENLPITPSHRRSQKLTPFFPRSATKLTFGSKQPKSVTIATDTGTALSLRPSQPISTFAPDRFKETDSRVISSFAVQQDSNKDNPTGASSDMVRSTEANPPITIHSSESSSDVDELQEAAAQQVRKIPKPPANSRRDESQDDLDDDEAIPNGISATSIQKQTVVAGEKKKRGRPRKDPLATPKEKDKPAKMLPIPGDTVSDDAELGDDGAPLAKKKRGRPPGSKSKSKSDTPKPEKAPPQLDANGQPIKRGRGRPPGSTNKAKTTQAGSPIIGAKHSPIAGIDRDGSVGSDVESGHEEIEANKKTFVNKVNSKASGDAADRKRKADVNDTGTESSKRAKNATSSKGLANADAMDESEDRAAVVTAAKKAAATGPRLSPNPHGENSITRSYSRSPAKEVNTSSSEGSYDTDTASENSGDNEDGASSEAKTRKNSDLKLLPRSKVSKKAQLSSSDSRSPTASLDQAAAQLRSEESASAAMPKTSSSPLKSSPSKRPPLPSSARAKYPSFSDIRQQTTPRSKQHPQSIRTNPEFDQRMRQQPKKLQSFTDDSSSSSESESDNENAKKKPGTKGSLSKSRQVGFQGLLNRSQN